MGDFVAYPSKWRIALLALLAAGFVVIGLWMIGLFGPIPTSRRYSPTFTVVWGWICITFFGFCAVAIVKRFFEAGEQLRIGPEGVWIRSWSDQTIPWTEITEATTWSYKGSKSIILHLRDPSLFPGRGAIGFIAKANRALTGGDISITLAGADRSLAEAIAAIDQFRPPQI